MRNALISLALAGGLTLGACQNLPTDFTNLQTLIKNDAQALCAFVPTASTIAAIVAAYVPGATPVEQAAAQIAQQICAAVTTPPAPASLKGGKLRGTVTVPVVVINGQQVEVHGNFVR